MPECTEPTGERAAEGLPVAVVPGVTIGRWAQTWRDRSPVPLTLVEVPAREAEAVLSAGDVDAAFLRLPMHSAPPLARIPLWQEETVVALSRENPLTLLPEIGPEQLAQERLIVPDDDVLGWSSPPGEPFPGPAPATTDQAFDLVAAEAGVCLVPKSLARAAHRRDVETRPVPQAPTSQIALAWMPVEGRAPELVEILIGIVRGRTPNSTRGSTAPEGSGGSGSSRPIPQRAPSARAAGTRGAGSRGAGSRNKQGRTPRRGRR